MTHELKFSEMLMRKAEQYVTQLGIPLVEKYSGTWDNMNLERFNTMLKVSGAFEGFFMFSVDDSLAFSLVNLFLLEKISENEISLYADKVVAEIANIIAGQVFMDCEEANIMIHVPVNYRTNEITFKPNIELRFIHSAKTEIGAFQCAFIRLSLIHI